MILEAIKAGFYNIDIDGSTLVELDEPTVVAQQKVNIEVTAEMIRYIRQKQGNVEVSIGGEIGHIGSKNSNTQEMETFLSGIDAVNGNKYAGLSKVSVQTGTRHGGVVDATGETQMMTVDLEVIEQCGEAARVRGVGGVVQHGASTLSDDQLTMFPAHNTLEIHLATGWQNMIMDDPDFPSDLKERMEKWMEVKYCDRYESREECIYRERKRAWGQFQKEIWEIEEARSAKIMSNLAERARKIQRELGMEGKSDLLLRYVK